MGTTYGPSQDASKSGRKLDSENGATKYGPPRKKVGFGKWAKGKGSKKFKERRSLEHPLLFLHLRKAGGSHICSMAREAHEKTIDSIEECNCNWVGHDWHPSEGRPDTAASCELRRSVFQQMHATFGMIEREFRVTSDKCPGFVYATVLREPVARMNSERIYSVQNAEKNGEPDKFRMLYRMGLLINGKRDFKGFKQTVMNYDNHYVRHVANLLTVPFGGINETHLQQAIDILADFDFIGISEDLRDARKGALFYERLNWTLPTKALSDQANSMDEYKKQVDTTAWLMTSSEEDWFKELCRWDLQLYQWAVDNFGIK